MFLLVNIDRNATERLCTVKSKKTNKKPITKGFPTIPL